MGSIKEKKEDRAGESANWDTKSLGGEELRKALFWNRGKEWEGSMPVLAKWMGNLA